VLVVASCVWRLHDDVICKPTSTISRSSRAVKSDEKCDAASMSAVRAMCGNSAARRTDGATAVDASQSSVFNDDVTPAGPAVKSTEPATADDKGGTQKIEADVTGDSTNTKLSPSPVVLTELCDAASLLKVDAEHVEQLVVVVKSSSASIVLSSASRDTCDRMCTSVKLSVDVDLLVVRGAAVTPSEHICSCSVFVARS